jgi:hypothetical protein
MGVRDHFWFTRQWEAARKLQHWWRCSSYRHKIQERWQAAKKGQREAVKRELAVAVAEREILKLRTQAVDEAAKAKTATSAGRWFLCATAVLKLKLYNFRSEGKLYRMRKEAEETEIALRGEKDRAKGWETSFWPRSNGGARSKNS